MPQPPQVFSVRGFEALVPRIGTLVCMVCLASKLFLPVYVLANVGPHANAGLPASPAASLQSPLHPAACLCHSYQSG